MKPHLFALTLMMILASLLIRPCEIDGTGVLLPSAVSDAGGYRLAGGKDVLESHTIEQDQADPRPTIHDTGSKVSGLHEQGRGVRRIRVIWSNAGGNALRRNPFS